MQVYVYLSIWIILYIYLQSDELINITILHIFKEEGGY